MHMPFVPVAATLVARPNRFVIHARLLPDGPTVHAHCPNPGRMAELMLPGATVYLSQEPHPDRRTPFTLRFVAHPQGGQLISLDTQLPNALFAEGLAQGFFPAFQGHRSLRREVSLPRGPEAGGVASRADFWLEDAGGQPCWVEVKSVSLVEEGVALFPDAPTSRGRRHLLELAQAAQRGERAAVVFIVQRPDAEEVRPHRGTDPEFATALAQAVGAGVEVHAATCTVSLAQVSLARTIPVVSGALQRLSISPE